jgi:PTS system cellobiose-specific IIB component
VITAGADVLRFVPPLVIEKQHVDVVLLGPQVRFMEADFKKKMEPKGIPVGVIPMADYGMMNGAKVLEFADTLMKG